MTRLNKSNISNATFTLMNAFASDLARAFGGKVTRNDTMNGDAVFSDDELNKYHKTLYIVRVEYGADRHNALEISVTAKCFYIAYGDALAESVREIIRANADGKDGVKRIDKWEMKTRCNYTIQGFADVVTGIDAAVQDAEKKATAPKTKNRAKKTAKKTA